MLKTVAVEPYASSGADLGLVGERDLEDAKMNSDQDTTTKKISDNNTENIIVKVDNKKETKADVEDPKPRIVLTFRSEKPGAKSSNMKIVPTEEKHEEISPRRSNRTRHAKWDTDDETETLISKKDKNINHPLSENEEASDSSYTAPKRSTRHRSKESDSVLANAIARKEKSYNETSSTSQRPSRRIKPTAKVLANKELHMENTRVGIDQFPEGGVRTRRSARRKSVETQNSDNSQASEKALKPASKKYDVAQEEDEELEEGNPDDPQSVQKLKHLCELGLKAINTESFDEDATNEVENRETEESEDIDIEELEAELDTELDDEPDIINKLIEEDTGTETSDEEFYCSTEASQSKRPRRSTRLCSSYGGHESEEHSSPNPADDESKAPSRRLSRRTKVKTTSYVDEYPVTGNPAGGDEGTEATCPEDDSKIIATCFCEEGSSVHAAPDELPDTVFCQAIELVDNVRVGCSHAAMKDENGSLTPFIRAGPRAPYLLTCKLHTMQLRKHMCCPACGVFCTQGIFYQCSEGHMFHLECGLPYNDAKHRPGCPHCGVYSYRWLPVNRDCGKVKLEMTSSNKRIYLPDQRLQCTPAYLGFSTLQPSQIDQGPVIPEDLLPPKTVDLKQLCAKQEETDYEELLTSSPEERLCEAIISGDGVEQLIPKIVSGMDINRPLEPHDGGTAAHVAARLGRLSALWLLQYASANLDAQDANMNTPLMVAVLALLDKSEKQKSEKPKTEECDNAETMEVDVKEEDKSREEAKEEKSEEESEVKVKPEEISDEDLMKVIRYLVATGCDVNIPGPEGLTALHMAAKHGSEAVCSIILSSVAAEVDLRDHGGWTPLVWAAENEHVGVVRLLLSHGADATSMDNEGNAVIHWCALAGDANSLRQLVDTSPHAVHQLNSHADTPLHVAAQQNHYACVIILLARGARTDAENLAGELPAEVCSGECQRAIAVNTQMALAVKDNERRYRLLSSDISKGRERFPVACVNEVDETPLPDEFTYVTQHVAPQYLPIDNTIETMQGCSCEESCASNGSACTCVSLSVRPWTRRGRLVKEFPHHEPPMLFECNQTCQCHVKQCGNNIVSRALGSGSLAVRATVFRTDNAARGWGLRALQHIPRGAPVASYCGELLTTEIADARPTDHYMFALDLKPDLLEQCSDKTQLCVDAAQYGSAARFINHSCKPNLAPVRVFQHSRDLRLPTVALFATTDIKPGEELTFDYGDKFWSVKSKWMKCECGTSECRYPTKSTSETES